MRFKNLEPPYLPNSLAGVLKWAVQDKALGKRRKSPRRATVPTVAIDHAAIAAPEPSLTWIGHATWLIRMGSQQILTDPVWSHSLGPGISRNVLPPLPIADVNPTLVVISHNHRDHLDEPSIRALGPRPTYVVPKGLGRFFARRKLPNVVELDWWETFDAGDTRVHFVPSQHWSQRGIADRNETLWGGYVLEGNGKRVYFAGDTAYFGGFRTIGERFSNLDAALLPIGAYDPEWFMRRQHMNPEDAARAFLDLEARLLCAMHWGTFKLTDEPLDEPPRLLEQHRSALGIAPERVWVAAIGETRRL